MLRMVLGILWKDKVSNKIRGRRLKLARHCIRHPELLLELVLCRTQYLLKITWKPKFRRKKFLQRRKAVRVKKIFVKIWILTKIIMLKIVDVKVDLLKLKE